MGELIPDRQAGREEMTGRLAGATCIVTVGDRTTEKVVGYGLEPDLQIVDGLERRMARAIPESDAETISCSNPAAHITEEAVSAIVRAYASDHPIRILVSGEEDLLFVPALVHAPEGAMLMYGQPGEGLVLVRADAASKERAHRILELLERDDETVAV